MPTEKEFEGKKWVLAEEVETIIAGRLSEVSRRKTEAEGRISALERELEASKTAATQGQAAAAQIAELREQLAGANARFERFSALSAHGITDPDVSEALVWAWERANAKLPKKDQQSFEDTIASWAENPDNAPASARPHFQGTADAGGAAGAETDPDARADDAAGAAAGGAQSGKPGTPAAGPGKRAAAPPPKQPGSLANKPGPAGKPLTVDEIYSADDKQLEALTKRFHGEGG